MHSSTRAVTPARRRWWRPLPLLLLLGSPPLRAQQPPAAATLLGQWRGTSLCVKAEWNAACHDEEVLYEFMPVAGHADSLTLHAARLESGTFQPMYDLDFHFDSATRRWNGDFSNARVRIRWSYAVSDTLLTGTVVLLPSGRIGRNVVARRPR